MWYAKYIIVWSCRKVEDGGRSHTLVALISQRS